MPWIDEVPSEHPPGEPDLPAVFQALSLSPLAQEQVKQLNETLAFGSSALSRVQEEAIATVVAAANRCRYGALTHGGFLRLHSGDEQPALAGCDGLAGLGEGPRPWPPCRPGEPPRPTEPAQRLLGTTLSGHGYPAADEPSTVASGPGSGYRRRRNH